MELNRSILRNRHRLSERQIDDFLGEETINENAQDRILGMQQIGSFLQTAKHLQVNGIEFINLKGPLLSERIYGDPTYRYSRDFDILIKPNSLHKTLQLLQEKGYEYPDFKWPESEKKQKITLHFLNQVEMVHKQTGVMLEIHWKLFSTRITRQQSLDRLMRENIESVGFGGVKLNRFSNEFELFYLIMHGGVHAWFRLKWLVDIHEMLERKSFAWDQFHHIISTCNAQKLVGICNAMLREYFPKGPQIPGNEALSNKLAEIAVEQCRQPDDDPKASRTNTIKLILYRMRLIPTLRYKVDVSKVVSFCKTDLKYDWLPPYKFAYYLFRPAGFILRGIGILK